MKMKCVKLIALIAALGIATTSLAGCAGGGKSSSSQTGSKTESSSKTEEKDAPPNDDSIKEFRIACIAGGDVNPIMSEWWIWEEYEKKTGIKINWEEVPGAAVAEKKNLMLSSNDMVDAFWQIGFSNDELIRYGTGGTFANISPYIEQYAPGMKSLFETVGGLEASMTMPDGNMYSLPWVITDAPQNSLRYYLNKSWLEAAGKEAPNTIPELEEVFDAFLTQDVNGNGNAKDEVPIYMQPGGVGMLEQQLMGSFGIGNNGLKPIGASVYVDDAEKIQYIYTSEQLKEIWKLMAKWWKKGYFHPETFGTLEYEKWVTDGTANDIVGMYSWVGANYLSSDAPSRYVPVTALEGPNGDRVMSWLDHPVRGNSAFTITKNCKAVGTLLNWADYFYTEEGSEFAHIGTEGVTYNVVDGKRVYVDEILKYKGGTQLGAFQYGLFVYGGGLPCVYADSSLSEEVRQSDPAKGDELFSLMVPEVEKYSPKELLPGFVPTLEESAKIPALTTDSNAYVAESRVKFVTGEYNFESDWDAYIKQINKMGVPEYTEIVQAQYERYVANK